MTQSQVAFQRNRDLADRWVVIAKASWFQDVLVHARSAMVERSTITPEQLAGAKHFADILVTLSDQDDPMPTFPGTKLVHELEPQKKTLKPAKSKP